MNNKLLLECHNLCKSYQEGNILTHVLKNVCLKLKQGEMVAITGSSGSGKSTLLHLLGGLDTPTSGEIIFNNKLLNNMSISDKAKLRNREIGFIYQFHHLLLDFNALENVAIPLLIAKKSKSEAKLLAYKMLMSVGLEKRAFYYPSELSGGERQRVAIARALVNYPRLVMADEPTGNLDTSNTYAIFDLLNKFNVQYGTTFLVVTHNLQLANRLNRQMKMYDGSLSDHLLSSGLI